MDTCDSFTRDSRMLRASLSYIVAASVCESVCRTLRLYQNGSRYGHEIFTVGCYKESKTRNFMIRKVFREIRKGSPRSRT